MEPHRLCPIRSFHDRDGNEKPWRVMLPFDRAADGRSKVEAIARVRRQSRTGLTCKGRRHEPVPPLATMRKSTGSENDTFSSANPAWSTVHIDHGSENTSIMVSYEFRRPGFNRNYAICTTKTEQHT